MAGKDVYVERPDAHNIEEGKQMVAAAQQHRAVVQMGYMFRHNPAFDFLFETLEKGWLGHVFQVRGVISKKVSPDRRRELARFDGGGMYELACHLVDAVVAVLGAPESVSAFSRRTFPDRDAFLDNNLAVFEYPRATATVRCAHVDPFGFQRRQFNVIGDAGAIEIRPLRCPACSPREGHQA